MPDFNMIGNDQNDAPNKGQKDDSSFMDTQEYHQTPYESEPMENVGHSGYAGSASYMDDPGISGSSKGIMYVLIGACVILFTLLMYLLFFNESSKTSSQNQPDTTVPTESAAQITAPVVSLNEVKVKNVQALLSAFQANQKLSVMRYSQGEFIIEAFAKSASELDRLNQQLKAALPAVQITKSTKTQSSVTGNRIANISGRISEPDIWSQPKKLAGLSYVSEAELKNKIQGFAGQSQMKVRSYDVGRDKTEDGFQKKMVRVKFTGSKTAATQMLTALGREKINLNFSKLVFLSADPAFSSNQTILIADFELFKKQI